MTRYYNDYYMTYKSESKVKQAFNFINKLFENPKIANIAGFVGAVAPVLLMLK